MYETTHSYRLARLLEMTHMGPTEFKRSITKIIPRELAYRSFNDKTGEFEVHNARELLTQQGAEVASSLIPIEVMGTIIEGSEPAKCIRNVFPIYQMNSEYLKIPYGETGTYAPIVAEGAEVPIQDQTYSAVSLTASKYAVRPLISREMVNDQKFDVIAAELRQLAFVKYTSKCGGEAVAVVADPRLRMRNHRSLSSGFCSVRTLEKSSTAPLPTSTTSMSSSSSHLYRASRSSADIFKLHNSVFVDTG